MAASPFVAPICPDPISVVVFIFLGGNRHHLPGRHGGPHPLPCCPLPCPRHPSAAANSSSPLPESAPACALPLSRRATSFVPELQRPCAVSVPAQLDGGKAGQRVMLGLADGCPCQHGTTRAARRADRRGPRHVVPVPWPTPTSLVSGSLVLLVCYS